MIGLGICFATCYRLRGDGQEGSRGNSISFWNDSCDIVGRLPRPKRRCGVVQVKSRDGKDASKLFAVRPNLLREALRWLINHNPLYANVEIDEAVLQSLDEQDSDEHIPAIEIDEGVDIAERQNANDERKLYVDVSCRTCVVSNVYDLICIFVTDASSVTSSARASHLASPGEMNGGRCTADAAFVHTPPT